MEQWEIEEKAQRVKWMKIALAGVIGFFVLIFVLCGGLALIGAGLACLLNG